jgi:hypothetical protein
VRGAPLRARWRVLPAARAGGGGLKCALNLAFADRYGWQRDELYYAVAGRHLHWFLTELREEVSSMSALLAVVERAAETNLLLAEDYLPRSAVGDQGGPEAGHQHPRQPAARFKTALPRSVLASSSSTRWLMRRGM